MGHVNGGSILVKIGTNNADEDGNTAIGGDIQGTTEEGETS